MSIRMRSRRGAIGTSWQGTALRASLEGVLGTSRSSGGRRLARADRVEWLDVAPRRARAGVLDDDGTIYEPELDVAAFGAADRRIVIEALQAHPELPARLSSGTYPQEVERELESHEATLLPGSVSELSHDCTCRDWPGPCVHVAALAYVLVEAIDEHPAHLLTLRGLTLREIAAPVAEGRGARALAQAARVSSADADDARADHASSDAAEDERGRQHAEGPSAEGSSTAGASEQGPAAGAAPETEEAAEPTAPGDERPGFDPAIADPTLLRKALGSEAAEALASFFGSPDDSGPTR